MEFVEAAEEEEVSDLFDDSEGVGYASGQEGVPALVDLRADFAGEHGFGGNRRVIALEYSVYSVGLGCGYTIGGDERRVVELRF